MKKLLLLLMLWVAVVCGQTPTPARAPDFVTIADNDTLGARLKDLAINVKTFGAKGDGSNDSAAVQNAIAAAIARGGGIVFLPPGGTYYVSRGVKINGDNVYLMGMGSTISCLSSGGYAVQLGSLGTRTYHTTIDGIKFTSSDVETMQYGIGVTKADDVTIKNCKFYRIMYPMRADDCTNLVFTRNRSDSTRSVCQIAGASKVSITDNKFFDVMGTPEQEHALYIAYGYRPAGSSQRESTMVISNNEMRNIAGAGIQFYSSRASDTSGFYGITCADNLIDSCYVGISIDREFYGLHISNPNINRASYWGIRYTTGHNSSSIVGGRITDGRGDGIAIYPGESRPVDSCYIGGGIVISNNVTGIRIGKSRNVVVSDVVIINNGRTADQGFGVIATVDAQSWTVKNSIFYGNKGTGLVNQSIDLWGNCDTTGFHNPIITGNLFIGTDVTAQQKHGVYLGSSATVGATLKPYILTNNIFLGYYSTDRAIGSYANGVYTGTTIDGIAPVSGSSTGSGKSVLQTRPVLIGPSIVGSGYGVEQPSLNFRNTTNDDSVKRMGIYMTARIGNTGGEGRYVTNGYTGAHYDANTGSSGLVQFTAIEYSDSALTTPIAPDEFLGWAWRVYSPSTYNEQMRLSRDGFLSPKRLTITDLPDSATVAGMASGTLYRAAGNIVKATP